MVAVVCVVVLCLLYRFVDGTWIDHDVVVISVRTLVTDPMTCSIDYRDKLYLQHTHKSAKERHKTICRVSCATI